VPSFPTRGVAHTNKYRLKKVENALTDAAERRKILDEVCAYLFILFTYLIHVFAENIA
jgi:hypothetical protein